jgi:septum formation protein
VAEQAQTLVLASASPRRLDLLRLAGLEPVVEPAAVDETPVDTEDPVSLVVRLARDKACAIRPPTGAWVLGADTTVVVDGAALGKPADPQDAVRMLSLLRGRTHRVSTAVAVRQPDGGLVETVVTTEITMAPLTDAAITAYVETGEPLDKAGAYGIQGRAAAFVSRVNGSWTNVVGLPLVETLDLLRDAGYPVR